MVGYHHVFHVSFQVVTRLSYTHRPAASARLHLPISRQNRFIISTVFLDAVAMVTAILVATRLRFGVWNPLALRLEPAQNIRPILLTMVVSAILGSIASLLLIRSGVPRPSASRAVAAFLFALSSVSVTVQFTRPYYSRQHVALGLVTWLGLALAIRGFSSLRPWAEDVIVISSEKGLVEDLRSAPHFNLVDFVGPGEVAPSEPPPPGTTIAVDLRAVLSDSMAGYVASLSTAGYEVESLTNVYETHTGRAPLVHLAEGWEIDGPLSARAPFFPLKRLADTLLIIVTLPVSIPLGAVCWLAVRLWGGPGPVLFSQVRVGHLGRPFVLYKFRSMENTAEENGARMADIDDPRITAVGRVLRRTRFDEIPQLWNIVRGEMSLVGPRAEQPEMMQSFEREIPFYRYRHGVRPGLTGWAQVNWGYASTVEETMVKLSYDLYYVRHMSPLLDISIMWQSIRTVLTGRGAR